MENQFKIEKAQIEDHLILSQITHESKAFWGYSKDQLDIWKTELRITPEYIVANETIKLIVNAEAVGYYSFFRINKNQLKLDNLFLLPNFISQGFGKILLQDFLKRANQLNVGSVILEADPNAENFYKYFGFKTYDLKKSSIEGRFLPLMQIDL